MLTLFSRPDQIEDPLHVITTVFNPSRYRNRWKLYQDFALRMQRPDVRLYTAEVAFGDREFAIPAADNVFHFRTQSEIWLKENALNLLVQRLPPDWKYLAWVDADISFVRDDWANETLHALQHYKVVQMWAEAHDLDHNHNILQSFKSMGWSYQNQVPIPTGEDSYYYYPGAGKKMAFWHPGFAWAIRRESFNDLGGFVDWSILGNADTLMGRAILDIPIGKPEQALGESGKRQLDIWKDRAGKYIQKNLGYVNGALLHYWHGPKLNRQYLTRNKILIGNGFNPELDLKRDWQGLWQLTDRNPSLRDGIRKYFNTRNEDAPY